MAGSDRPNDDQSRGKDQFPYSDLIDAYWDWDVAEDRTTFSPQLHKLTGYTTVELERNPSLWAEIVHPEDLTVLKDVRQWALKPTSSIFNTKLRVKARSGEWLWHRIRCTVTECDGSGAPIRVSGVMFDISEQEAFKSTLEETGFILRQLHSISTAYDLPLKERLNRILIAGCEHFGLPNGIISCVEGDQYEVLAVHSTGSSIKEGDVYPLGKTFCNETLKFGGAVYFENAGKSRFKTHPCYLEFGLATYIGTPIEVDHEVYGTLNFSAPSPRIKKYNANDNEILKLMGQWVGSALTRKKMARTLLESERQFQHAQRLETVGRLVGGVAHDINNLLMAIIGYTDLARMELTADHLADEDLSHSMAAAKRGARITRRLLGFSSPASYAPCSTLLDVAILETQTLIAQLAGEGIEVVTEFQAEGSCVLIDPAHLDQVLMNLAVNSRDAMPLGGAITITTRKVGTEAIITFTDTGCGMDKVTLDRVFEPYFTTKSADVGTGLGLATLQSLVQKAGGRVGVQSEVGQGTSFTIGLPLSKDTPTTIPEGTSAPSHKTGVATILLIEAEEMVRHTVTKYLEKAGHRVLAVENGHEADDVWSDRGTGIDMIISDAIAQGGPGWEFAFDARANGRRPLLVFMSAFPTSYLEETGHPALFYPIIEKPFDFEALNLKLEQIMG